MPPSEALTESFCERCGTRYEFSAPTQLSTLRKTRGLISGLRNYIMSQDALSDAVGDAMRSEEETLAARQLEAFHESFNFCIQCRQYACTNCWNDPAGRCRTCVPIPGTDDLIERFEASFHAQHPAHTADAGLAELGADDLNRRLGVESWPTADLGTAAASNGEPLVEWPVEGLLSEATAAEAATTSDDASPEREPVAEAEPAAEPEPEPATFELATLPSEPLAVSETAQPVEPEPMLPALEGPAVLRWEDDAAFELEPEPVVEPEPVAYEAPPTPEPVVEPEPVAYEAPPAPEPEVEPEPVVEAEVVDVQPEAEPVAYEAPPTPEPEAPPAPRPIVPINETILRIPSPRVAPDRDEERVAAEADDPALAARRAKLDMLGLGDPGEGPVSAGQGNVLPYRSSGASVHPAELAAGGDAQAAAQAAGSFWDASAREVAGVMTHVGVQSCGQCGLSLSASARFCRRCGTRQARSA